jgi:hypothetical protein
MRVVHSGTNPAAAKREFTSIVGGMVEIRTRAAERVLASTYSRVLARGPRSGRRYRYRGQTLQASAPGEPPQERSGLLRRTPYTAVAHVRTSRGWRGTVTIAPTVPYAGFLVASGRVIGVRVLELAMPALRAIAWRRRWY